MNTNRVFPLLISLTLTACGGGGGGSGDGGGQSQIEALVPTGKPVLFVHSTLQVGGGSDLVVQTITQFDTVSGETLIIDLNDSFSFSRSSTAVLTFDDRLLWLRNSGSSGESGGDWTVIDVDAQVDKSLDQEFQPVAQAISTAEGTPKPYCVGASAQTLYWENFSTALVKTDFSGAGVGTETVLTVAGCFGQVFTIDSLNRVIGGMDFADGQLYDLLYNETTGNMTFYARSPAIGNPVQLASLTPTNHAAFNPGYAIGFDNDLAYIARVETASGQLEIWSYDFINLPQLILTTTINGISLASVSGLDADDGYIVVRLLETGATAFNSTNVLLFDSNGMTTQIIDLLDINPATPGLLPPTFSDVEIMFRQP